MPRGVSSSYAPKSNAEVIRDTKARARLAADRQRRQDAAMRELDDATLDAMTRYQIEKRRAAAKGKPVLSTIEEYRTGVRQPDQYEHQSENSNA